MRFLFSITLIVSSVVLEGCWFRRKAQTPAPPQPPPPPPAAAKKKTVRPAAKPKAPAQANTPGGSTTPAEARPQFGPILTEEQKSEFRNAYEQSISAASDLLAGLAGRQLSSAQQESVARIKSFLDQAREATATNWSLAAQLARRAELLARDLLRTAQ